MNGRVATDAIGLAQALRAIDIIHREIIRRRVGFSDGDAGRTRGLIRRRLGDDGPLARLQRGLSGLGLGHGVCVSVR